MPGSWHSALGEALLHLCHTTLIYFQKLNLRSDKDPTAWASNMGCPGERALLAVSIQSRAKLISHRSEMLSQFPSFSAPLLELPVIFSLRSEMYNKFCRGDDPVPSLHAVSTQSLSLFQLLMRGFSCGPRWLQLSPSLICLQMEESQGGRRLGGKRSPGSVLLWFGALWVVQPLGGALQAHPVSLRVPCLAERHQGCASLAMTGGWDGTGSFPGSFPCPVQ